MVSICRHCNYLESKLEFSSLAKPSTEEADVLRELATNSQFEPLLEATRRCTSIDSFVLIFLLGIQMLELSGVAADVKGLNFLVAAGFFCAVGIGTCDCNFLFSLLGGFWSAMSTSSTSFD